jgi:hypothetical protein
MILDNQTLHYTAPSLLRHHLYNFQYFIVMLHFDMWHGKTSFTQTLWSGHFIGLGELHLVAGGLRVRFPT